MLDIVPTVFFSRGNRDADDGLEFASRPLRRPSSQSLIVHDAISVSETEWMIIMDKLGVDLLETELLRSFLHKALN